MPLPVRFSVSGLFGRLSHQVDFEGDERVAILTGPNGSGKTHVLNIMRAVVGQDFLSLMELPFESAQVFYANNSRLAVKHLGAGNLLEVSAWRGAASIGSFEVDIAEATFDLPAWVTQLGPNRYRDERDHRGYSRDALKARYPRLLQIAKDTPDWLAEFAPSAPPVMIATGRLDTTGGEEDDDLQRFRRPEAVARIVRYAERIEAQVADARRASLSRSQLSDRGFAVRALDKARATVKESELRSRYLRVSLLNKELASNGLTEETVDVAIPTSRTNPTERRILNLFLDDWEAKLAPLLPIHQRLQLLKEIVGGKMSQKDLVIGSQGDLGFRSINGDQIPVEVLSSGEQHLLALYTMLLFSASEASLVLIDEPEISLHASWKHAFVEDVQRIAELNSLQMVLATHSTGIVNGRWDLVQEIGLEDS